jgi:PiT family inorganic phosphate transporter
MIFISLFLATLFLAYSNGANDNFKGVATLFGSQTTSYKTAIWWATLTTFAGSVASVFIASTLIKNFSGKGLVPDAIANTPEFRIAVAIGAALTIIIATFIGFPISTTHSLTGALVGAGIVAQGFPVNFSALGKLFFLPLLFSPLIAIPLGAIIYIFLDYMNLNFKIKNHQKIIDTSHFMSSGIVSFARGLNDTPKIVALVLIIKAFSLPGGIIAIAVTMSLGGLFNAHKVAKTMSKKITSLNHIEGLSANIVTGSMVIGASSLGLPVSTTHVSVGSIFGVGLINKNSNLGIFYRILLSWLLTLPIAAMISVITYKLLQP